MGADAPLHESTSLVMSLWCHDASLEVDTRLAEPMAEEAVKGRDRLMNSWEPLRTEEGKAAESHFHDRTRIWAKGAEDEEEGRAVALALAHVTRQLFERHEAAAQMMLKVGVPSSR